MRDKTAEIRARLFYETIVDVLGYPRERVMYVLSDKTASASGEVGGCVALLQRKLRGENTTEHAAKQRGGRSSSSSSWRVGGRGGGTGGGRGALSGGGRGGSRGPGRVGAVRGTGRGRATGGAQSKAKGKAQQTRIAAPQTGELATLLQEGSRRHRWSSRRCRQRSSQGGGGG